MKILRTLRDRGVQAAAFAALLPALAPAAAAAPPEPAVQAAPGVEVRYEERKASHVLYLEEKGGMVSALPSPVPDARRPAPPPPVPAHAVDPVRAAALAAKARAAPRAGVGKRP